MGSLVADTTLIAISFPYALPVEIVVNATTQEVFRANKGIIKIFNGTNL